MRSNSFDTLSRVIVSPRERENIRNGWLRGVTSGETGAAALTVPETIAIDSILSSVFHL